jgi:hypothetical protein
MDDKPHPAADIPCGTFAELPDGRAVKVLEHLPSGRVRVQLATAVWMGEPPSSRGRGCALCGPREV